MASMSATRWGLALSLALSLFLLVGCDHSGGGGGGGSETASSVTSSEYLPDPFDGSSSGPGASDSEQVLPDPVSTPEPATGVLFLCAAGSAAALRYYRRMKRRN